LAAAARFSHPSARQAPTLHAREATLVQLSDPGGGLSPALRASGARLVSPSLNVWRVPAAQARRTVAALRAERLLARAEPDQRFVPFGPVTTSSDPLVPDEWWIHDVGDDQVEAPGPGVPVTVLDTGLDLSHPEFKSRPDTTALNAQVVAPSTDPQQEPEHGTAVSSIVAAPSNGVGG